MEPNTDQMKVMTPKIFIGNKKKGRFTKETRIFEDEVTIGNLTNFFAKETITHAVIFSKTAALYDPMGFTAPVKVFGSYICRKAFIETHGDPLKEVSSEPRQYLFQV